MCHMVDNDQIASKAVEDDEEERNMDVEEDADGEAVQNEGVDDGDILPT